MEKKKNFYIPRAINAHMVERYIFNFRMKPEALEKHLPVSFLKPQVFNGWSLMSFCILKLEKLTIPPIPPIINFKTITCAYRAGIMDYSKETPEPSVWITDRNTNLKLCSLLAPLIIKDELPMIEAAIGHVKDTGAVHTQFSFKDGQHYFSAEVKPAKDSYKMDSAVFNNVDEFASFIKNGVSSYTPSSRENYLACVDLHKDDTKYEALDAEIEFSWLHDNWRDVEMNFDSAVRATGSNYRWTYKGLLKI